MVESSRVELLGVTDCGHQGAPLLSRRHGNHCHSDYCDFEGGSFECTGYTLNVCVLFCTQLRCDLNKRTMRTTLRTSLYECSTLTHGQSCTMTKFVRIMNKLEQAITRTIPLKVTTAPEMFIINGNGLRPISFKQRRWHGNADASPEYKFH